MHALMCTSLFVTHTISNSLNHKSQEPHCDRMCFLWKGKLNPRTCKIEAKSKPMTHRPHRLLLGFSVDTAL